MVRIISDTSTMYSAKQAREAGFDVLPLAVTIAGQTYRELDEIEWDKFIELIRQGNMPVSSQPAVGEVMDLYQAYAGEEIVNIAMADGLSGTYQSAAAVANMSDNSEQITVINSGTLCGPHRCIVEHAAALAAQGADRQTIVAAAERMMQTDVSFLMPDDFDYLRRGGRLSPLVSFVGKTIHLAPVLTQSEDGRQLVMAGVKRSFRQAVEHVAKALEKHGVSAGWRIYISHADAPDKAEAAKRALLDRFPAAELEIYPLTPAFITQGGPGCVAIQAIQLP